MALYIIGIGLSDEKDITIKGLEAVKRCSHAYLETYTSVLQCSTKDLERFYGKKIIPADRNLVENKADDIIDRAKDNDVALLVAGDPMSATTHVDIMLRAKEKGIDVRVIHNASVLTAVGITGLQLYKFGRTTSIPFPDNVKAEAPYDVLKQNKAGSMHTLILLDLDPRKDRFMTIKDAIDILNGIEEKRKEKVFTRDTLVVGCARLGSDDFFIKAGKAEDLEGVHFGKPPYCLIVPSGLHFMEEEALKSFS